jgi:hypothetical protein
LAETEGSADIRIGLLLLPASQEENMGMDDFVQEVRGLIEELVARGQLDKGSTQYAITQQLIAKGRNSLSAAQEAVFDNEVAPLLMALHDEYEQNRIPMPNPE